MRFRVTSSEYSPGYELATNEDGVVIDVDGRIAPFDWSRVIYDEIVWSDGTVPPVGSTITIERVA